MRELSCPEIGELLPAYALDALETDEYVDVALHLAECRNHDDDLAAYRASANNLASALEPVEPPPSLRASLLAAFEAGVSPQVEAAAPPSPVALAPTPRRLFHIPSFAYGLAAAAVLVIGLLFGGWLSAQDDDGFTAAGFVTREMQAGGQRVTVLYIPDTDTASLFGNMDPLPEHLDYQVWRITADGKAESLGVMPRLKGAGLAFPMAGSKVIALTIEPRGGSPAPTSAPIASTEL